MSPQQKSQKPLAIEDNNHQLIHDILLTPVCFAFSFIKKKTGIKNRFQKYQRLLKVTGFIFQTGFSN